MLLRDHYYVLTPPLNIDINKWRGFRLTGSADDHAGYCNSAANDVLVPPDVARPHLATLTPSSRPQPREQLIHIDGAQIRACV